MPEFPKAYQGISRPTYTQVPDEFFDLMMPFLSEAECKVVLYIIRRTFGFGKDRDAISVEQICTGIVTREGERLDYGTGLSRASVYRAIGALRDAGVIDAAPQQAANGGGAPSIYRLVVRDLAQNTPHSAPDAGHSSPDDPDEGGVQNGDTGGLTSERGGVSLVRGGGSHQRDPQETVRQETEKQETVSRGGGESRTQPPPQRQPPAVRGGPTAAQMKAARVIAANLLEAQGRALGPGKTYERLIERCLEHIVLPYAGDARTVSPAKVKRCVAYLLTKPFFASDHSRLTPKAVGEDLGAWLDAAEPASLLDQERATRVRVRAGDEVPQSAHSADRFTSGRYGHLVES